MFSLGEITTTALLDRELKSEYILIVRAVDGGVGPQQKTGIATVTTLERHLSTAHTSNQFLIRCLINSHLGCLYV